MILFLVNTFPSKDRKNDGAFNLNAAKQLSSSVDLKIIHLRSWHPKRKFIEKYQMEGLVINVFSFPLFPKTKSWLLALQLFIYKKVFYFLHKTRLKEIEVVHSVGASFSGIVGSYIAKKSKIKHIAQCIGSDINFNMPLLKDCFGVKGWNKYVDYFGCNSGELSKSVKNLYPDAKTVVIYRGVDLKEFPFNVIKYNEIAKTRFLFLGGLSVRNETPYGANLKGGITVLKAWKRFIDSNPDLAQKAVLWFGGPQTTTDRVITEIGISEIDSYSIEVIGQLDKQSVKKYMQQAHVVLVPSMAEGLPNVAMEAAASGCAIIATDVGGTNEIVVNEYNGKLIEGGNVGQLAESFKGFSQKTAGLKELGENSRRLVENKFDNTQFCNGYMSVYDLLMKESQNEE